MLGAGSLATRWGAEGETCVFDMKLSSGLVGRYGAGLMPRMSRFRAMACTASPLIYEMGMLAWLVVFDRRVGHTNRLKQ